MFQVVEPRSVSSKGLSILKPIYENLSSKDLLERCLGVYSQNNENLNSLI